MSKTKERIHDSNLRYKQGLGQNFIYDEDLLGLLRRRKLRRRTVCWKSAPARAA